MRIDDIIESGLLEEYATGSLPHEEVQQVQQWCMLYPEVADELRQIEIALENYATQHAQAPPDSVKQNLAAILDFAATPTVVEKKRIPLFYQFAMAAGLAAIALLSVSTLYYSHLYKTTSYQLATLRQSETVLANQVKQMGEKNAATDLQLTVMADTSNTHLMLAGMPIAPMAKAMVYWDRKTGTTFISSQYLPASEENQQYQLWAIVDGKPVDLGVISKESTFQKANEVMNAQAFAITLEPMGGLPSPTMEKLYVMGKVGA